MMYISNTIRIPDAAAAEYQILAEIASFKIYVE